MFSYLQSKFTIPLFLGSRQNPWLSAQLTELSQQKQHVVLSAENPIDLKRQVLAWTQDVRVPLVWLRLDALDVDPGRFWTVLIYGLRKHYPAWGQKLLSGIMDHHASPNPQVFAQFKNELAGKPFVLVLSDCGVFQQGTISKQLLALLEAFSAESMLIFLKDNSSRLFTEDSHYLTSLAVETEAVPKPAADELPQERNLLAILDTWWLPWLKRSAVLKNPGLIQFVETHGYLDFLTPDMLQPNETIRIWLRDPAAEIDYDSMSARIRDMTDWLVEQGEWLEAFRWLLFIKAFEAAGELLETYALPWLTRGGDALTLLFWLRELPSVLLSARPLPAYLAAKATFQLGLKMQTQFYLTNVEHNLEAMARFSRSPQQLTQLEITDGGLTYQQMADLVLDLKRVM